MSPTHSKMPASLKECPGADCPGCTSATCFAKGGDVAVADMPESEAMPEHADDAQDMEGADSELSGMMGDEIMSALESKDKKRVMESLEAFVMHCMSKG